jgi:putative AdoMet-dependent methyltransferase
MRALPRWQYDEFRHIGVDYADVSIAENYDEFHTRFRGDMAAASDALLDRLQVKSTDTLVDLGCGTGTFAMQSARRCATVYAVDVSPAMLAVARRKAGAAGILNINFHNAGFLTYEHPGAPVDFVVSSAALHHLPDFWKLVALRRVAGVLKTGGVFYLMDTVYSFDPDDHASFFSEKSAWLSRLAGEAFGEEALTAFREEFSTCDWIMEGLLTRAGFRIEYADYPDGMLAQYVCRKDW